MVGKIACLVVLCMVVVAPHAEALTCGQPGPQRTADSTCTCLKSAASAIKGWWPKLLVSLVLVALTFLTRSAPPPTAPRSSKGDEIKNQFPAHSLVVAQSRIRCMDGWSVILLLF
ncbi:tyrosine protein phosphatase [Datura stramonium]|uniref:Tyrosine protein phosphatase n=1 Tax=Datura stramonium TaxID=4076 RepID=A0ABS8VLN1_DATST|nr:tyrosine protein phosphatase [Datura stramonium]